MGCGSMETALHPSRRHAGCWGLLVSVLIPGLQRALQAREDRGVRCQGLPHLPRGHVTWSQHSRMQISHVTLGAVFERALAFRPPVLTCHSGVSCREKNKHWRTRGCHWSGLPFPGFPPLPPASTSRHPDRGGKGRLLFTTCHFPAHVLQRMARSGHLYITSRTLIWDWSCQGRVSGTVVSRVIVQNTLLRLQCTKRPKTSLLSAINTTFIIPGRRHTDISKFSTPAFPLPTARNVEIHLYRCLLLVVNFSFQTTCHHMHVFTFSFLNIYTKRVSTGWQL